MKKILFHPRAFPSLFKDMVGDELYAFQRSPSFSGRTEIYVVRTGPTVILRASVAFGDECTRQLDANEWAEFQASFNESGFWTLPEYSKRRGLDGETWRIEGWCGKRRNNVQRWLSLIHI